MHKISNKIPWHYPRAQLAATLFQLWENDLSDCITLQAPVLGGKSQFLQYDLCPLLEKQGWATRYFSCAQVKKKQLSPSFRGVLIDFAMGEHWLSNQLRNIMSDTTERQTSSVASLFAHIRSKKKHSVLLIDDVDLLLENDCCTLILEEIFSAMRLHGQYIKILFASNSLIQGSYPKLLAQHSTCLALPEMGIAYVDHLFSLYQQLTQNIGKSNFISDNYAGITWGQIDRGILLHAFEKLQHSPSAMRALVEELVLDPEKSITVALERQLQQLQRHRMAALGWEDLERLDRLLLLGIAEGRQQFYEKDYREWLATQMGTTQTTASQIQSSLKKMLRNKVIAQITNYWQIIDPQLTSLLRKS